MTSTEFDASDDVEVEAWGELRELIELRIGQHERSQQVEIGASSLGGACARKLAHRLAATPHVSTEEVPWRQTVGTAVHSWLADMQEDLNQRELRSALHTMKRGRCKAPWCNERDVEPFSYHDSNGDIIHPGAMLGENGWHRLRFAYEFRIPVGTINGRMIYGNVDSYDRLKRRIVDWKIAGPKSLKDHHAHGMGDGYKVQQQTYGRGCARIGMPVDFVATCFLPMNGELRQGYVLAEPFDREVPAAAFRRARAIEDAIIEARAADADLDAGDTGATAELFRKLKTANDYCHRCAWFTPGTTDFANACPGDKSMFADLDPNKGFEGLL